LTDIDFAKIRPHKDGRPAAFEELVCQLARRSYRGDAEFRRVAGSGGDGGIEAYWLRANGKKIGYQAKYYLRNSDIKWSAIDDSVKNRFDKASEP